MARTRKRLMSEINVVPYIDVMLVLLIIFMITAPLLTQGISVELPDANAAQLPPDDHEPVVVSIDRNGQFYVNVGDDPEAPVEAERLREVVEIILRREPQTPVAVKADENVLHGRFVTAMAALQQAGASKIGILTDPPSGRE